MNDAGKQADKTREVAQPAIRTIAQLERDFVERQMTLTERLGDAIGGFAGSLAFLLFQVLLIGAWVLLNSGLIPFLSPFDKPPFTGLQLIFSVESIFLLTFVLMRENRMRRQEERRAQLELQVNLLAERESTEVLRVLLGIAEALGLEELARDRERQHLSERTHLEALAQEVKDHIPEQSGKNGQAKDYRQGDP